LKLGCKTVCVCVRACVVGIVNIAVCFVHVFQEFHVRRLHCLLTDFIVLMPLKLKELRNRADETARTMQVYTHVRYVHN
jgi:hypothetical protein